MAYATPRSFNLPSSTDVDYFVFTAEEPNQTLELTFSVPTGGRVSYALYSGAQLNVAGSASAMDSATIYDGTTTLCHMLEEAGTYYVKATAWSSSTIFEENATIAYRLILPDANERNNTWKTATPIQEGVAASYTLPTDNDVDWFKLESPAPDQTVEFTFSVPVNGRITYALYSGADFTNIGDNATSIDSATIYSGTSTIRHMLNEAGTYYVKLSSWSSSNIFDEEATVTYALVEPDGNERNNTWSTATELTPQTPISFTLHADNDTDYFKLAQEISAGDHITIQIGNIPTRSSALYVYLYVVTEGAAEATSVKNWTISSNSTSFENTYTVQTPGTYYLRIYPAGGVWVDQPMWVKCAVAQDDIPVTGVSISNGGVTIAVGQTLQLYGNVSPSNATNQAVTWESSNTAAATIDANGLVTAKGIGSTTITATGTTVRPGTVAVDPRQIPFGTKMYIVSNDGAYLYGFSVAEDTGGAIRHNRIDLFFPSQAACIQFGVRNCTVYILD